jgi:hypothetical protein
LLDLIRFREALTILDVHSWVPLPGCLVNPVAPATLACISEVTVADLAKIRETDILGIPPHLGEDILNLGHTLIVSLSILFARLKNFLMFVAKETE